MNEKAIVITTGLLLSAVGTNLAQQPAPTGELPPNQWVKVGENEGGLRAGAAVTWLNGEKTFLVIAGVRRDTYSKQAGIPVVPALMTYDPASGKWAALPKRQGAGPFKFNPRLHAFGSDSQGNMIIKESAAISGSFAPDPEGNRLFVYTGPGAYTGMDFRIYCFDIAEKNWALLTTKAPPARTPQDKRVLRGGFAPFMRDAVPVFDPVNQELVFIGGQTGNDPEGCIGNWAFSVKDKAWRELREADPVLDPLHASVRAAVVATRDAMAAARNIYYAAMDAAEETKAIKGGPLTLLNTAAEKIKASLTQLAAAKGQGWKEEAIAQARTRVEKAQAALAPAGDDFNAGQVSRELIKGIFTAAWLLDEAADCVRSSPGGRYKSAVVYDPVARSIVVFGGDHGDYLLNDTWVYDCATRAWKQLFPPVSPRARMASGKMFWLPKQKRLALAGGSTNPTKFYHQQRATVSMDDVWSFDCKSGTWTLLNPGGGKGPRPRLSCALAVNDNDELLGLSTQGKYRKQKADYWMMRLAPVDGADASTAGVAPGTRTYFAVTKEYDPRWYDGAPRGSREAVKEWVAKLKPNTWTEVPRAPRPAPQRDWGTCVFDPGRDQWYHWTGGHMADLSDMVSTYHPAVNRWSVPYVGGILTKGIGFNGRPDCRNHTYLTYDFDPVSKKLVTVSAGGTCIYDPDRREFEPRIRSPFAFHPFSVVLTGTPIGVVCQAPGFFGVLDVANRQWKKLPIKGEFRSPHVDGTGHCYDSKRNAIWNASFDGYQKPSGLIWRYSMDSGTAEKLTPANRDTIGKDKRTFRTLREIVYLPELDLLLFNNFHKGKQVAYDPEANSWVLLGTTIDPGAKKTRQLGGVGIGLMRDAERGLVWAMGNSRHMLVLKTDPQTLVITRDVPKPQPAAEKE